MTSTATETATCNKQFTRNVKGGAVKTFKCEKPKGHDTGEKKSAHGLVRARREVSVKAAALASFEAVPNTEFVPLVGRERSDEQKIVDGHVKQAHTEWTEAGKPEKVQDSPRSRYLVPAEDEEGVRTLIRRAADYLGYRVQIAPAVPHESGNVSIQFRVSDKKEAEKPSEKREAASSQS